MRIKMLRCWMNKPVEMILSRLRFYWDESRTMLRQCWDDAETTLQWCWDDAGMMLRWRLDDTEMTLRRHWDHAETTLRWRWDNDETTMRLPWDDIEMTLRQHYDKTKNSFEMILRQSATLRWQFCNADTKQLFVRLIPIAYIASNWLLKRDQIY